MNKSQRLIIWYRQHKRNLPWRETNDPYKIWLSEIILQQTRVQQGTAYYLDFINEFPDIQSLAKADEEKVLKLWQGLGYYSRARNLHYTAKMIVKKHKGKFPDQYKDILELKGIGKYTAAAIASFAFHQPYPVLDGNVIRVITRLFNITDPVENKYTKSEIEQALDSIFDHDNAGEFNQAIMEFGALVCTPKNPRCESCPFVQACLAFQNSTVQFLPNKTKKTKTRNRYFAYFIIQYQNTIFLNKRNSNDIWKNLYDFPLIETSQRISEKRIVLLPEWKNWFKGYQPWIEKVSKTYIHKLSHQKLYIKFIHVKMDGSNNLLEQEYEKVSTQNLNTYPVPVIIHNYLEKEMDLQKLST